MTQNGAAQRPIIAIDGPAGAGKSTLAKIVADRLGYLYVDTGAMYRALALKALRLGIDHTESQQLAAMAAETDLRLERGTDGGNRVLMDGVDVSEEIRDPAVTAIVSRVSAVPELRQHMIKAQRDLAACGGVVMDGRDIGSYVLPNAHLKFYVTASLAERSARRAEQLKQAGHKVSQVELEAEIAARDEQDMNKGVSSLVQLPESILIDTTGKSVAATIDEILSHCRRV